MKDFFKKLPVVCVLRILDFYSEMQSQLKRERENALFLSMFGENLLRTEKYLLRVQEILTTKSFFLPAKEANGNKSFQIQ